MWKSDTLLLLSNFFLLLLLSDVFFKSGIKRGGTYRKLDCIPFTALLKSPELETKFMLRFVRIFYGYGEVFILAVLSFVLKSFISFIPFS